MYVSKTYDIVTPESAEQGDAAERGFEYENERVTEYRAQGIRSAIEYLSSPRLNDWDHGGATVYGDEAIPDYRTGGERSEALHFKFETPAEARAFLKVWTRWFKKGGQP